MSDESEPDWSLLPRNPAAFFGLAAGFDLRALKSAYGALIRRYKPEKAPEEFQKIRAAFESLKLFFEETAGGPPVPPSFPTGFQQPVETPRPRERPRVEKRRDDPRKAAPRSLRAEYEERRTTDAKSPKDYYALALLADLVGGEDTGFAWWLHAGLRSYPDEPALSRLLSEYLGTDEAAKNAEWLLVATSQAVPGDRFYDVSRPLWDRLLGAVEFATFRALLDACEANLDGDPGEGYVAFYWWLLRRVVWEPHREWFDAKIADLESLGDLTRWDAARDRDLVDLLIIYRQVRHSIVTKRFVRTEMDRTVIACTTSSQAAADRRMLEAQQAIAAREREVLLEFPPDASGVDPLVIVWEHLSADTSSRLGISVLRVDAEQEASLDAFAATLPTIGWRPLTRLWAFWVYGLQWIFKAIIAVVWTMIVFAGGLGVIAVAFKVPAAVLGGVVVLTGISLTMRWLWRLVSREQVETLAKVHRRLYRHVWRPRLIAFLKSTPVPIGSVVNQLLALASQPIGRRRSDRAARIAECIANDIGLRLFQIATMFRPGPEE